MPDVASHTGGFIQVGEVAVRRWRAEEDGHEKGSREGREGILAIVTEEALREAGERAGGGRERERQWLCAPWQGGGFWEHRAMGDWCIGLSGTVPWATVD